MKEEYPWRTGRSCVFKTFYHLVFVTKYRRNVFSKSMLNRINTILQETCEQLEAELLEFNGEGRSCPFDDLLSTQIINCSFSRKTKRKVLLFPSQGVLVTA